MTSIRVRTSPAKREKINKHTKKHSKTENTTEFIQQTLSDITRFTTETRKTKIIGDRLKKLKENKIYSPTEIRKTVEPNSQV